MKPARRRKTPETSIGQKIRIYARTYAANGQKERAEGMLQAADLVDELWRKDAPSLVSGDKRIPEDLLGRIANLEVAVFGSPSSPPTMIRRVEAERVIARIEGEQHVVSTAHRRKPRARTMLEPSPGGEDVALGKGEERLLAAIAQHEGLTIDALIAVVALRETSVRTYLGNLHAGNFIEKREHRHYATASGRDRAAGGPSLPVGAHLFAWWVGRLHGGPQKILQSIGHGEEMSVADLVGEATRLKETSVRTYVGDLKRQRLIVGKGRYRLAPILEKESC